MGLLDLAFGALGQGIRNQQASSIAADQRKFDLQMWEKSNLYNSPEMQMQRLIKAGLNPNLVYGSSSVVGNTSSPAPKFQMYEKKSLFDGANLPTLLGVLGQFQNIAQSKAQENLARKNAELVDQKISTEFFNTLLKQVSGQKMNMDYRFARDTFENRSKLVDFSQQVKEQAVRFQKLQSQRLDKMLSDQFPLQTSLLKSESELAGYNAEMGLQKALNAKQLGNYNLSDKDSGILKTIIAVWSAIFGNDNR